MGISTAPGQVIRNNIWARVTPLIDEVLIDIINWDPKLRYLRHGTLEGISTYWSSPSCNCKPSNTGLTPNPYKELCNCEPESGGLFHYSRSNTKGLKGRLQYDLLEPVEGWKSAPWCAWNETHPNSRRIRSLLKWLKREVLPTSGGLTTKAKAMVDGHVEDKE
ncbi:uncharacterized protein BDZ99DRAFT_478169 [Mytilinidion resinicola]|uniref:Uncharacterized protein n=1 Tax=Mytilinidion resinicola TaxID=574789 RepID=A0A6A6YFP0_9PEZI|nr:uncharacterized protein BDZ99DRAFT_478169 [Mytilinidion resinicola]KAF2807612.1 hypothetical protein BDZ99DRAFT_478169 [Mytilinidion resinicola]